ncbi:armadillo-type protein [Endogone sp. FLAS-F59071]|nr:armadillo-type protein [Endogone sp. FLAS-F59071]|eukprot:RUS15173.1 armadillo-type protein [Endogone sp. FLAS-F59071]
MKRIYLSSSPSTMNTLKSLCIQILAELSDPHHRIRAACIRLLALLSPIINRSNDIALSSQGSSKTESAAETSTTAFTSTTLGALRGMEIQTVISNYVMDADARVRGAALQALIQMHLRGCPLDLSLYFLGVAALKDDYEDVRVGGLNLIWVLSSLYPEHMLKLEHESLDEYIRLLDDAFIKICDMVNDSSVDVRTKACTIMASYQHVDANVLSQTFSKQIMSHLKRRIPPRSIPTPEGDFDVEADEFRLLDSGACGAFVHGLEDEYQDVRNASIDSICELCMYNDQFTTKAIDFLVDMFNDEIDHIRLNAITSLRKIGSRATLIFDADQLEIALGALEDADKSVREGTHELLRVVRLATKDSMNTLIQALLVNMQRYPEDRLSIYRCFRDVGRRHNDYIEDLVPSLLHLSRHYLPKEANQDDQTHISYLILIFNACISSPEILSMLPKYAFRHHTYLSSRFPECFPDLDAIRRESGLTSDDPTELIEPIDGSAPDNIDIDRFMAQTLELVGSVRGQLERGDYTVAMRTVSVATRDLKYVGHVKPLFSGKAEFAILFLECCKILVQIKQTHLKPAFALAAPELAARLLRLSYTMENTFMGLAGQTRHSIMYFRVLANMVWLFGMLKQTDRHFERDDFRFEKLGDLRISLIKAFNFPTANNISTLYSLMMTFVPLEIELRNPFKRTTSALSNPVSNPDKPYVFNAAFPLRIDVEAELSNVADISSIAIEVTYPDQTVRRFWPPHSHFLPTRPYCFRLTTHVEVFQNAWTEQSHIEIQLVRAFEADLPAHDDYILRYPNARASLGKNDPKTALNIGQSVRYFLKPEKR